MLVFDHDLFLLFVVVNRKFMSLSGGQPMAVVEFVNFFGLYISHIISHGQVIKRRRSSRVNSVCVVF